MTVNNLIPQPQSRVRFSLSNWKLVPKSSGCYALTTFDGVILYLGLSENLHRRFSEHRDTDAKRLPTQSGLATWFYYLLCDSEQLNRVERTWLNEYVTEHGVLPVLNKINSPVH